MTHKTEEKKPNVLTEEAFDFAETSDMCDFGYVLAGRSDRPSAPIPAPKKKNK